MDLDPTVERIHRDRREAEFLPAEVQEENTKRC